MNKMSKVAMTSLAAAMMAGLGLTSLPAATAQPTPSTAAAESQVQQHKDKQQEKEAPARKKLEKLNGTQSQKEIDRIAASDEPATVLIDTETGKVVAAELQDPNTIQPLTYQLGPGCTTTSVCVIGTTYYGFEGGGAPVSGNWPGARTYQTGIWTTSLGYKTSAFAAPIYTPFLGPGKTAFFSNNQTVTVTRVSIA